MSVVSTKIIFCEGKESSLDSQLLGKIFDGISDITIVPAGSKFTFSIFAQGYFYANETTSQNYIVFRDRDFDLRPGSRESLLEFRTSRGKVNAYLSYRACVENYLLDANLIHQYWQEKYQEKIENSSSKWGHGDSPGIEKIENWIRISVHKLKNYQAVRWALGDLLSLSSTQQQLKTTWTGGSGMLPSSLELEDCKDKALQLVENFRQNLALITPQRFEENCTHFKDFFEQENFWIEKQYLIWFHGKDIQKSMQLTSIPFSQHCPISLSSFFKWGLQHLDVENYPDLKELRTKIQQFQ